MRVRDHRSDASRHHDARELAWRHHRAFYVHVRVNEPRRHVGSAEVVFDPGVVPRTHRSDMCTRERDVRSVNLAGGNVDELRVPQHDVGRLVSARHRKQPGQMQPCVHPHKIRAGGSVASVADPSWCASSERLAKPASFAKAGDARASEVNDPGWGASQPGLVMHSASPRWFFDFTRLSSTSATLAVLGMLDTHIGDREGGGSGICAELLPCP